MVILMKRSTIVLIIISAIAVGLIIYLSIINNNKKEYFNELDLDDVIEKVDNKETFVLLLSQTTCSHCMAYKPKLQEVANKYEIMVFYLEVDLLSDDEKKELKKYFSYEGTPTTIFVINGEEKTAANRINGEATQTKIISKLKSNGFI